VNNRIPAASFFEFLDVPLRVRTRIILALLCLPLLASFFFPLWEIHMVASQYPNGLTLEIFSSRLVAGNDGADLNEINILNHYIGMHQITEQELRDLNWLPFAFGAIVLLTVRVSLLGNVRALADLTVLTTYVSGVAFARFIWMLFIFGHHLSPDAPVKVTPFMPVILGSKKIANFTTSSYPLAGSYLLFITIGGLWILLATSLLRGRRRAAAHALLDSEREVAAGSNQFGTAPTPGGSVVRLGISIT